MAGFDDQERAIEQRAYRDLAAVRVRRQPARLLVYLVAAVLSLGFVDGAWGILALAAIAVSELAERRMATDFLARVQATGDPSGGLRATGLASAHLATGISVALGLSVILLFAEGPPHDIALFFLAAVVLAVSVENNQVLALTMTRQAILLGAAMATTVYRLLQEHTVSLPDSALPLFALGIFAVVALTMSHRSVAAYRQALDREFELQRARDAAEEAGRIKSNFLATVSHELRTPLNGMLGMTQTLLQSDLTPEQRNQLEVIAESGRALNALLTDILDFSKLEAGKLSIRPAEDDLHRTVDEVIRLYGPVAGKNGLSLKAKVDPEVPQRLVFDAVRVRQCLSNLVSNAVKFTETGEVAVTVDVPSTGQAQDEIGEATIRIVVRDTGIGIPADRHPHLFQPFSQADISISRRFGGTGLGLSITRQLAESMGGTVGLKSAPGQGSEFSLTFRAGLVGGATATGAPDPGAELAGCRVLVADAAESNRMVMRLFLQPLGIEVVEAANSGEAIAALERGAVDAALLDLHLAGPNGSGIASTVRTIAAAHRNIPLIAVAADAAEAGSPVGKDGFDALIQKPVDHRQLQSVLRAAIQRRAEPAGARASTGSEDSTSPGS